MFKAISLLARTVAGRVENIDNQLKNKAEDVEWVSLAFLIERGFQYSSSVVIQEVNSKFEVFEELVLKTVFME